MTLNRFNRWLERRSASIQGPRHGRRLRPAFRPDSESLERRLALSTTVSWTGDGTNANWSNRSNWFDGELPVAGDAIVFPASAAQATTSNNDLAANTSFKSITFEGAPYIISGNAITIAPGGAISDTVAGSVKLNLPIVVSGSVSVTTADRANLNLGGAVSGDGGLSKAGKGQLVLSGSAANTFTNGLSVTQGTVQLSKTANVVAVPNVLGITSTNGSTPLVKELNNEEIGSNARISISTGSTLDLSNSAQSISDLVLNGGQVIGSATGNLILVGSASATGNVAINVPVELGTGVHSLAVTGGSTLTINAPISGYGATKLIKAGSGILNLAGSTSNTYNGETLVNSGTLLLSKSGTTPAVAVPGHLFIGGVDNTNLSVVRLQGNNQISDSAVVTVYTPAVLDLNKFATSVNFLDLVGGSVTNGTLTLDGSLAATSARATPSSAAHSAVISAAVQLSAGVHSFHVSMGPAAVDLDVTGAVQGAPGAGLTKTNNGTMLFSGSSSNTYTGTTTVLAGTLELGKTGPDNSSIHGPLTISANTAYASAAVVRLVDSNEVNDSTSVTVYRSGLFDLNNRNEYIGALTLVGGQVSTGTGVLSLNRDLTAQSAAANAPSRITGKLSLGPPGNYARTFTVNQGPAPAADLIINGAISGSINQVLVKNGTGTLELTGSTPNTFVGETKVNQGVLELAKTNSKAIGGQLLVINGASGDAHPATVSVLATDQFFSTVHVDVLGSGQFNLNGNRAYVDDLTMSGGVVTTGANGQLFVVDKVGIDATSQGSTPATITGLVDLTYNNAEINVTHQAQQSNVDLRINGELLMNGESLTKTGNGVLLLSGNSTSSAIVRLNVAAGTLQVGGQYKNTVVNLNGGTVDGSGAINSLSAASTAAKQLSIGTSTTFGVLTATNGATLSASTTFTVKIGGGNDPVAGVGFDQLTTAGKVDLNGAKLTVQLPNFIAPDKGTPFRIINNTGSAPLVGQFVGLSQGSSLTVQVAPGKKAVFTIDYGTGTNKNGVDLVYEGTLA